jgi:hypothetical protein
MKPPREVVLPIGAHQLAVLQARSHARVARNLVRQADPVRAPENLLAYLVNAGLALELYFKAMMIAGRGGRVTTGHSLATLFAEFPPFLGLDIEARYLAGQNHRTFLVTMVALTMRGNQPATPQTPTPVPPFGTFSLAMQSLDRAFEDARYFFENLTDTEWALFAYAPEATEAAMNALDGTYEKFKRGEFLGNLVIGHAPQ